MDFASTSYRQLHPIADAFKPVAWIAAGVTVIYAVAADAGMAWAAAAVAGGAIVVPRAIDWYRELRAAKREEDARDVERHSAILAAEVTKRVQLEGEVRDLQEEARKLKEETATNRHKIRDLEQQILLSKAVTEKLDTRVQAMTPDPDALRPIIEPKA